MSERRASPIVVAERDDARSDGPMLGAERAVLDHWLELYRETVLLKIGPPRPHGSAPRGRRRAHGLLMATSEGL